VKALVITLVVLLAVLHQDFWWWDDRRVVLGFLPLGLAWHAAVSLAAGLLWWLAVGFCWPPELEVEDRPADAGEEDASERGAPGGRGR
jgi:hypothetical protein